MTIGKLAGERSRMNQVEYLPLCDLLFNIISLLSYFSDIVFDLITVYTLYVDDQYAWFGFTLSCIVTSTLVCQLISIRWHVRERRELRRSSTTPGVLLLHVLQCGVLWRYFRLFIPTDLRRVKRAVRDLCILRLIHFGGTAGPMLLVHFYRGWTVGAQSPLELTRLSVVSTSLCMFSVCWALASFSKHIRQQNLHKLVLTWLGVIYQFLWRLGTISSRVAALTLYATVYNFWVLLVIALHWLSMCLWLVSNFPFRGEKLSRTRKCALSLLVAYVHVFCYLHVDLQETNARHKMVTFYLTVFLENTLLLALWWHGQKPDTPTWHRSAGFLLVWGGFAFGVVFMLLYYRYFHVTKLKHGLLPVDYGWPTHTSSSLQSCTLCQLGTSCLEHYNRFPLHAEVGEFGVTMSSQQLNLTNGHLSQLNHQHKHSHSHHHHHHHHAQNAITTNPQRATSGIAYIQLPGVFNCRLNPAFKRKKKKPTTFIPIPVQGPAMAQPDGSDMVGIPFWKRPSQQQQQDNQQQLKTSTDVINLLSTDPTGGASGSKVNIRQKLLEKRQKQLQELRVIEEEIKQGKFQRPHPSDLSEQGTLRQPIPRLKKQPIQTSTRMVHPITPSLQKTLVEKAEILLAPHCLDSSSTMVYYDYWEEKWRFAPPALRQQYPNQFQRQHWHDNRGIPSDLDSQVSLPRSFTLPKEFRYSRKLKARRVIRLEHFVASTNSSDGDVDSGDDNDSGAAVDAVSAISSRHNRIVYQHLSSIGNGNSASAQVVQQLKSVALPTSSSLYHHPLGRSTYNRHETQL